APRVSQFRHPPQPSVLRAVPPVPDQFARHASDCSCPTQRLRSPIQWTFFLFVAPRFRTGTVASRERRRRCPHPRPPAESQIECARLWPSVHRCSAGTKVAVLLVRRRLPVTARNQGGHAEDRLHFEIEFPTFEEALRSYIQRSGLASVPSAATIAVAGPVTAGQTKLTNRNWLISEQELRPFGCDAALLINDFVALAFAAETLGAADLRVLGPELKGLDDAPISILGAGTG